MKYVGKTDLKIGNNAVWHEGNFVPDDKADKSHGHTKSQITDFPSSLPANGGTANKANILVITDTRDIDDTPGDLQKKGFTGAFKRRATVNNPPVGSTGSYVFIMTVAGYGTASDGSGGWPVQVAFGIEGLAYRRGTSSTAWGPWDRISNLSDIPTSLPANGGNAATVNGKTVAENVPANAKFTDTTYTEITESEIDTGTASTLRAITARRIKYILDKVQNWISGLTKADVGLGNVQNYGIASQSEAEAGTSNSKNMTPLRVKQSIDKFKPKKLSELTNDIGAGGGINIITSPTEPPGLATGDQWHKTC